MPKRFVACFQHPEVSGSDSESERLYAGQARLRYERIHNLGWTTNCADGLECDEYDRPSTWYIVSLDRDGEVQACLRICRTDDPFMFKNEARSFLLRDQFAEHCYDAETLIVGPRYWEPGRLCRSEKLATTPERNWHVFGVLVGLLEFSVAFQVEGLYGVMPPKVFARTWGKLGVELEQLGPRPNSVEEPQVGLKRPTRRVLDHARSLAGIDQNLLDII